MIIAHSMQIHQPTTPNGAFIFFSFALSYHDDGTCNVCRIFGNSALCVYICGGGEQQQQIKNIRRQMFAIFRSWELHIIMVISFLLFCLLLLHNSFDFYRRKSFIFCFCFRVFHTHTERKGENEKVMMEEKTYAVCCVYGIRRFLCQKKHFCIVFGAKVLLVPCELNFANQCCCCTCALGGRKKAETTSEKRERQRFIFCLAKLFFISCKLQKS